MSSNCYCYLTSPYSKGKVYLRLFHFRGFELTTRTTPQTQPTEPIQKTCNCRDKPSCPLNGECLTSNVVYQGTVTSEKGHETYIGLTEDNFKNRFRNHTASFRDKNKRNATELSKYIWSLKDSFIPYSISWKIIARANSYSSTTKRFNLCLTEKFFIICKSNLCSLLKMREMNWEPHAATQRIFSSKAFNSISS